MNTFDIVLSFVAEDDIDGVYHYIADVLMSPLAAIDYRNGIYDTIAKLSYLGYSLAVSDNEHLAILYGNHVRTIRYKRMTVVYNMVGDTVYVRRVMASGLVH